MSRRIGFWAVALAVGLSAVAAHAQLDILSGKRLTQPGGRSFVGESDTPKFTLRATILPAAAKTPARLSITADILPDWHIYSITQAPGGPIKTRIRLEPSSEYRLIGEFQASPPPLKHLTDAWKGLTVEEHSGEVTWQAPIEFARGVDPAHVEIQGEVSAQACATACLQQSFKFTATLGEVSPPKDEPAATGSAPAQPPEQPERPGEPSYRAGHASIRGLIEPGVVAPGGKARLILSATPEKPYHVYALADHDTGIPGKGKPTLIEFSPDAKLQFGRPVANAKPASAPSDVPGGGQDSYYTHEVNWTVDVSVPRGAAEGDYPISGLIGFHTCKAGSCDAPSAARFAGILRVGSKGLAAPSPLSFTPAKYDEVAQLAASRPASLPGEFEVTDSGATTAGLPLMILFSLLGGLILNLMPCVLPVIGLKVLAFVEQSGHSRGRILLLNLWYAAGMLVVFMVLATLAVTLNLGWGQQFSSTGFNITMCGLVFAMALSFLGVWEIPIPGFVGAGGAAKMAAREGAIGAFAKGVITTVLATPCSGPFLGSVFGFTLKQPHYVTFLIFGSIGLGMASPYLLIGAFPRLVGFLPKPGAWMETFKQLMAFMLLGTVVFMFSFMDRDYLVPTFALLIGIWAGCWWIGRTPWTVSTRRKVLSWLEGAAIAAVVGSFAFTYLVPRESLLPWQTFSQPKLAEFTSEGKTVMIDFTAEWCANCKLNMLTAINTRGVRDIVEANRVVPLLADWTQDSPEITQMLAALGSKSIPVLAIFPAGRANQPIILRDVITQDQLIKALEQAGPSQPQPAVAGQADKRPAGTSRKADGRKLSRN